jgi:trigger factor
MQTEVKEIGPCKLSVKIEITKDKVKEKLTAKYKEFIDDTVIPGFRKGQAPQSLVERKFGKLIKEDAKMDLMRESYSELLKEKKLSPFSEPVIEAEKITLDENNPLVFEFTIEVNPTIEIGKEKYTKVNAKKVKIEVKEKEIKDALEQLRFTAREYIPAKEGEKIEKNDLVIVDQEMRSEASTGQAESRQASGRSEQTVLSKQENVELIVGQEINIFNKPSAEVASALTGMKAKEIRDFNLTIPADYPKKELAGKLAVLKITLKEHKKLKLPTVNDAWAKEINFDSLEHLKKEMEKRILEEKEHLAQRKIEEEIIEHIVKTNDFPLPETLIEHATEHFHKRQAAVLAYQGTAEADIKTKIEENKTANRETVVNDLKAHFIVEHIAKQEKLFVTEDEVTERINEIASQTHKWPHEIKAYYEKNDMMGQLRSELKEGKVRKFLRENAVLTD